MNISKTSQWVRADIENVPFQSGAGIGQDPNNTGNTTPFVTALLKNNGQNTIELKAGNAQAGVLPRRLELARRSPLSP